MSKTITKDIMSWYDRHQRDLPWRRTRDPYRILVSEIMLQQTQVDTVIPYYDRFLKRFPTVEALAGASLQQVLKVWENMGYYSRARHLHEAAKVIVAEMEGAIPATLEQLLGLPGIGSYTAAAVLSFAFGQSIAVVDANIRRVLCRLFAVQEPMDKKQTQERISAIATELVPRKGSSRFNQGLMDLGATVCTTRNPCCGICPVQKHCAAFQKGLQEALPVTRKRAPIPHKEMTAGIIADNGCLLIVQRPDRGLLGGLWKFPGGERQPGENLEHALRRVIEAEVGLVVDTEETIASVKHAYTHFRITLHAFGCVWRSGEPQALGCDRFAWVEAGKLSEFPFSKADRKIIRAL